MAKVVVPRGIVTPSALRPASYESRVFGLACKTIAGIGADDFAYSPPVGVPVRLLFVGIWYGGADLVNCCGGTINISFGTGVPDRETVATRWDKVVPFWAGTTKPSIMVQGQAGYLHMPMNRLFTGEALRFGLAIENFSAARVFWVNVWFEISEG